MSRLNHFLVGMMLKYIITMPFAGVQMIIYTPEHVDRKMRGTTSEERGPLRTAAKFSSASIRAGHHFTWTAF
jgi:hypothetical protein